MEAAFQAAVSRGVEIKNPAAYKAKLRQLAMAGQLLPPGHGINRPLTANEKHAASQAAAARWAAELMAKEGAVEGTAVVVDNTDGEANADGKANALVSCRPHPG